jgi:hypothetical protein
MSASVRLSLEYGLDAVSHFGRILRACAVVNSHRNANRTASADHAAVRLGFFSTAVAIPPGVGAGV